MATRKIKDAKDLSTNELIYFKGHAKATYMSDGQTVEDAINSISSGTPDMSGYVTDEELAQALTGKQAVITDLDTIREGASKGATALQSVPSEYVTETELTNKGYATTSALNDKVDKVSGKQLSTEDFTSALKIKLEGLSNYDDTAINSAVSTLRSDFDKLVSGDSTTAIKTFNEIIAFLDGIADSESLDSIISSIEQQIAGKQATISDLATIRSGAALGATAVQPSSLSQVATSGSYNDLSNKPTIPDVSNKVDKVSGKGLSTNDYTTTEKNKLAGIASGAEVNVQSDWNVTDSSSDAYIKNKPTIPVAVTESTVSGWGFTKNIGTYSKPSGGIPKSDLASAVQTSLGKADTALQSYTEQYKGTITGVSANGTSVATSGVANIPAASTSAYGVTKLSSATNSTSTTLAATPSAVKAAYDLANSYKGTVTGVKINGTTKNPSSGVVDLGTVITSHQDISGKQDKLVSGTNIKTINGTSILGSGDITISGGSGGSSSGVSGAYPEVDGSIYKQEDMLGNWYIVDELMPNTFYVFPECGILDVSLGSETAGIANEYLFQFTSGSEPTTLSLPESIKWSNDEAPVIEANKIYQISILNGLGTVMSWDNAPTLIENKATLTSYDTITFQYPVASDLTISVGMATINISSGEQSVSVKYPEPDMPIMAINPVSDSTYIYTF